MRYIIPWIKVVKFMVYFFDISKSFDKVSHEGLIFKLKQKGITSNLLNILEDFLRNRKKRAVLNG